MQMIDGIHNPRFRVIIQSGRGFIQYQHLRVFIEGSGNANSLPLTAGYADSSFSDSCIQSLRQPFYELVQLGLLQSLPYFRIVNIFIPPAKGYIFTYG